MKPKFEIGEKVKVVKAGSGIGSDGLNDIVTILDIGVYRHPIRKDEVGYMIKPSGKKRYTHNTSSGNHGGYCGESSFEALYEDVRSVITKDE